MEIRQISWSDQEAFEKFQALLLVEKAAGNSFVETKKVVIFQLLLLNLNGLKRKQIIRIGLLLRIIIIF